MSCCIKLQLLKMRIKLFNQLFENATDTASTISKQFSMDSIQGDFNKETFMKKLETIQIKGRGVVCSSNDTIFIASKDKSSLERIKGQFFKSPKSFESVKVKDLEVYIFGV